MVTNTTSVVERLVKRHLTTWEMSDADWTSFFTVDRECVNRLFARYANTKTLELMLSCPIGDFLWLRRADMLMDAASMAGNSSAVRTIYEISNRIYDVGLYADKL